MVDITIEKTKTGYSAYSPDLPGCIATGGTAEETIKNMNDAIILHTMSEWIESKAQRHIDN